VAATLQSNLSGLARALVQKGRLAEREAEALQAQANAAGVGFIEQLISAKKMREMEIAEFASQTFGIPLLDLALFDQDFLPKKLIDEKLMIGCSSRSPTRPTGRRTTRSSSRPACWWTRSWWRTASSAP
jgi:type IV pilus assembly protein PilB